MIFRILPHFLTVLVMSVVVSPTFETSIGVKLLIGIFLIYIMHNNH